VLILFSVNLQLTSLNSQINTPFSIRNLTLSDSFNIRLFIHLIFWGFHDMTIPTCVPNKRKALSIQDNILMTSLLRNKQNKPTKKQVTVCRGKCSTKGSSTENEIS